MDINAKVAKKTLYYRETQERSVKGYTIIITILVKFYPGKN